MESETAIKRLTRVIGENSAAIERCKLRCERDPNSQFPLSTLQQLKDRQVILLRDPDALMPRLGDDARNWNIAARRKTSRKNRTLVMTPAVTGDTNTVLLPAHKSRATYCPMSCGFSVDIVHLCHMPQSREFNSIFTNSILLNSDRA